MSIQHPGQEDINKVFDFMVACDIAEYGQADTSMEDLQEQWDEIDLEKDTWVVIDNEKIVAYACISGEGNRFHLDIYLHKDFSPAGIGARLLEICEARARQMSAGEKIGEITLVGYACSVNAEAGLAYQGQGYQEHTHHYRMQYDFSGPVEDVTWPAGFEVTPFRETDETELYELIKSTFDWSGYTTTPIESWRNSLFRGGRYDPELFILLRYEGRLVGAALCYDETESGWVRQLAISKELQGKGFGSRMLKHVFHVFYQRKLHGVGLGVAAANAKAAQFYLDCGMQKTREFIEYHKKLEL